jgi:hypothetical protein
MTKDKMTDAEKRILEGMGVIFNVDICPAFECPKEGCDKCPIHKVVNAQQDLMVTIERVICDH